MFPDILLYDYPWVIVRRPSCFEYTKSDTWGEKTYLINWDESGLRVLDIDHRDVSKRRFTNAMTARLSTVQKRLCYQFEE